MYFVNTCHKCGKEMYLNQDFCPYCGSYMKPSNREMYQIGLNLSKFNLNEMSYEDKEHIKKQDDYLKRALAYIYSNYNGYSHEAFYEAYENLLNIRESNWILFFKGMVTGNYLAISDKLLLKEYGNPNANIIEMANYLRWGKKSIKEKRDIKIDNAILNPNLKNSGVALGYSLTELGSTLFDKIVYNGNKRFIRMPNHLLIDENKGGWNTIIETNKKNIPKSYYEKDIIDEKTRVKCSFCGEETDVLYNVCPHCGTHLKDGKIINDVMSFHNFAWETFDDINHYKGDLEQVKYELAHWCENMGNDFSLYEVSDAVKEELSLLKWQDIIYDLDYTHDL